MARMTHFTTTDLDAHLDAVRRSPADAGTVVLLVRRPQANEREELELARLDPREGLVGDRWKTKPSSTSPDGGPDPRKQVTLMNRFAAQAVAGTRERWALAGDQVFTDLDLSEANLPAGTRLALGTAVIEISELAHLGCAKFSERFGPDALRWVNHKKHRALRLRGVNAAVVAAGEVRPGDAVRKLGDA